MDNLPKPRASIIVPTYNRAKDLPLCLDGLVNLETDPAIFEIIIIDNNSSDNTHDIIERYIRENPGLRIYYLCETKQGASSARNRGVRAALGEIICFTEDDAIPYPDWLNQLLVLFEDQRVGCVGGRITLNFQGQAIPIWYQGDLKGFLGSYELPYSQPTEIKTHQEYPWGGNMAIRKSALDEVGLLRCDLGRSGGKLLSGEETELIDRIVQAGWKVLYASQPHVQHLVPPHRLEKSYLYRTGKGLAATHVLLTLEPDIRSIVRCFASDTLYACSMFIRFLAAIVIRKKLWFDDFMRFWIIGCRVYIRIKLLFDGYSAASILSQKW